MTRLANRAGLGFLGWGLAIGIVWDGGAVLGIDDKGELGLSRQAGLAMWRRGRGGVGSDRAGWGHSRL